MADLVQQLATELAITQTQVQSAIRLIDEGASVPFIARYRKEATQGLDDVQLRRLHTRLIYLRDLFERREKVINALTEQQQLNDDLKARLDAATSKQALEEIYAPYRPKRTSKAFKALEAGLGDYASRILTTDQPPQEILANYQHDDYPNIESQLEAIQAIIIDEWAKNIALSAELKHLSSKTAMLRSRLISEEKREVGKKFRDYFELDEPLHKVPSHRLLAMLRGRQENVLSLKVVVEDDAALARIRQEFILDHAQPQARHAFLIQTAEKFWREKIRPQIENALLTEKRLAAETQATEVFAENLRHLLLSAPAGARVTLGVDPGIRSGVKLAVVNPVGDVLAHSVIYPFAPNNDKDGAMTELSRICREYQVDLIAIGNGTASRETEALIAEMMAQHSDLKLTKVMVSEAGASVYSASELATQELPELDVSIRGAVSIARRLQDPLAELVKIEPKAIGVGQYQHDVNQAQLAQSLDAVVEDCVNAVGVDVNTASAALLRYIAGLNQSTAQQIVEYRKANGAFRSRQQLKNVPRLGERTFEQAAGFLRILNGSEPLDASAVHPESYDLVQRIAASQHKNVSELLANAEMVRALDASQFVDEQHGLYTVQDVLKELEKPGRDPRPAFRTAQFRPDITQVSQLTEGMRLEGVVSNVTNFGAFVDIGVHQDGLVHISELANGFVSDPHKVVKPGQIVQVRVLQVDAEQGRINLSMKAERSPDQKPQQREERQSKPTAAQSMRDGHVPRPPRRENANSIKRTERGQRQTPEQPPKAAKPVPQKIGGLGELLIQAGIKAK